MARPREHRFSHKKWTSVLIRRTKNNERMKRDQEAGGYNSYIEGIYGPFRSRACTLTLKQYLGLKDHETWLDAGSGVGRMGLEMAPGVRELVCLDHSKASLDVLRAEAGKRGLVNIRTHHDDLCNFAWKAASFDGILCNEVLQHIPSAAERLCGLKNLYRVLKPGGRCLVNVIRWQSGTRDAKEGYWGDQQEIYRFYFTPEEIRTAMLKAGFDSVELRGLDILPERFSRLLPPALAWLDVWCSRICRAGQVGNNILAIGIKSQAKT